MRDDFTKILVERPRLGGGRARKGRNLHHTLLPKQEGIKQPYGYNDKTLNENLAPLKRFIAKQVGRPWDKVFSEICVHVKPGNTVQEHIFQHLYDYIYTNVVKVPPSEKFTCGLKYRREGRFSSGYESAVYDGDIYVDPDDKIIKKAKRRFFVPETRKPKREAIWYDDKKTQICVQDKGLWYVVKAGSYTVEAYKVQKEYRSAYYEQKNPRKYESTAYRFVIGGQRLDALSDQFFGIVKTNDTLKLEKKYGIKGVYGIHLTGRQLNTKDLKRLKLKNEVTDAD